MKLRRVRLENVRSFLEPTELTVEGDISIIIGPNGGGKTNLLDATIRTIRRHLLTSWVSRRSPTAAEPNRYEFQQNDSFNSPVERHYRTPDRNQLIELEVEVTKQDLDNISAIKASASKLSDFADKKHTGSPIRNAMSWNTDKITLGQRCTYKIVNDVLQAMDEASALYRNYLSLFEVDSRLREEMGVGSLSTPMLSLPVTRTAAGFQSSLSLANYDEFSYKKSVDAATSRQSGSIAMLAVGRLAEKYRLLLEDDDGHAKTKFYADPQVVALSATLKNLGYSWQLESINPRTNEYDIRLTKQGTSFLVGAASSGEKEILTYLFGIFALNVKDALIFIDEPEMHLHPKWQATLLRVFEQLASKTGNQFLLATHSPIFVSPASIQYVSRVYSENQQSKIQRLNRTDLPDPKHLFSVVNSQNNESIFFSDKVILVEGISDRLVFNAVFKQLDVITGTSPIFDIVSVGGKGFFGPYTTLLRACDVPHAIIADLDYVWEIGSNELKELFVVDDKAIKNDVIENDSSVDGATLVARLDHAIKTNDLAHLVDLWTYIKGRRRRLKPDLSEKESALLKAFIENQRAKSIFVLSRGDLETYLPEGYKSKDLDKLIRLLSLDFWSLLPEFARDEFKVIADGIR